MGYINVNKKTITDNIYAIPDVYGAKYSNAFEYGTYASNIATLPRFYSTETNRYRMSVYFTDSSNSSFKISKDRLELKPNSNSIEGIFHYRKYPYKGSARKYMFSWHNVIYIYSESGHLKFWINGVDTSVTMFNNGSTNIWIKFVVLSDNTVNSYYSTDNLNYTLGASGSLGSLDVNDLGDIYIGCHPAQVQYTTDFFFPEDFRLTVNNKELFKAYRDNYIVPYGNSTLVNGMLKTGDNSSIGIFPDSWNGFRKLINGFELDISFPTPTTSHFQTITKCEGLYAIETNGTQITGYDYSTSTPYSFYLGAEYDKHWIKLICKPDGTREYWYSTDGENYTKELDLSTSMTITKTPDEPGFCIGNHIDIMTRFFEAADGTSGIDLNDWVIKDLNGNILWTYDNQNR